MGGLERAAHHGFVVGERGAAHLRQRFAGRRVAGGDQAAGHVLGPAESAAPGAGVDGVDAETLEDPGDVGSLPGHGVHFLRLAFTAAGALPPMRRWCPASPLTTTAEDTSFVPPGA